MQTQAGATCITLRSPAAALTALERGLIAIITEAYLSCPPLNGRRGIVDSLHRGYLREAVEWLPGAVGALVAAGEARRAPQEAFEGWLVERYAAAMPAMRDSADYHYLRAEWERSQAS